MGITIRFPIGPITAIQDTLMYFPIFQTLLEAFNRMLEERHWEAIGFLWLQGNLYCPILVLWLQDANLLLIVNLLVVEKAKDIQLLGSSLQFQPLVLSESINWAILLLEML